MLRRNSVMKVTCLRWQHKRVELVQRLGHERGQGGDASVVDEQINVAARGANVLNLRGVRQVRQYGLNGAVLPPQ